MKIYVLMEEENYGEPTVYGITLDIRVAKKFSKSSKSLCCELDRWYESINPITINNTNKHDWLKQ